MLRKKQDQNELNKARAWVKELEANIGNVQADLKAKTNQLEKIRPTITYLIVMIRKIRGMIEQLATQAAEIDLNPEQQNTLTALLNDNEALVEGICKKLSVFARRAFDDSDDQFNAWVKEVNKNIPVSTTPSQISSTPTIASVEKPKKRVTSLFEMQSKGLQRESGFAQITEQARAIANPTVTEPQSEQHSPAIASFVAPLSASTESFASLFGPLSAPTEPAAALPEDATAQSTPPATASTFPFPPKVVFTPSTAIRLMLLSPIQSRKRPWILQLTQDNSQTQMPIMILTSTFDRGHADIGAMPSFFVAALVVGGSRPTLYGKEGGSGPSILGRSNRAVISRST